MTRTQTVTNLSSPQWLMEPSPQPCTSPSRRLICRWITWTRWRTLRRCSVAIRPGISNFCLRALSQRSLRLNLIWMMAAFTGWTRTWRRSISTTSLSSTTSSRTILANWNLPSLKTLSSSPFTHTRITSSGWFSRWTLCASSSVKNVCFWLLFWAAHRTTWTNSPWMHTTKKI